MKFPPLVSQDKKEIKEAFSKAKLPEGSMEAVKVACVMECQYMRHWTLYHQG